MAESKSESKNECTYSIQKYDEKCLESKHLERMWKLLAEDLPATLAGENLLYCVRLYSHETQTYFYKIGITTNLEKELTVLNLEYTSLGRIIPLMAVKVQVKVKSNIETKCHPEMEKNKVMATIRFETREHLYKVSHQSYVEIKKYLMQCGGMCETCCGRRVHADNTLSTHVLECGGGCEDCVAHPEWLEAAKGCERCEGMFVEFKIMYAIIRGENDEESTLLFRFAEFDLDDSWQGRPIVEMPDALTQDQREACLWRRVLFPGECRCGKCLERGG